MQLDKHHPTVAALISHQGDLTDKAFSKRWLTVSETTWFRVRTGSYKAADHTAVLDKLTADLGALTDHLAITAGNTNGAAVLDLNNVKLGIAAVRRAFGQQRNRLVVILGETGAGKTVVAQAIAAEYPGAATVVEASETWRDSYLAPIAAAAKACGLTTLPTSARKAEGALIETLQKRPRILIIDEGNYFGPAALNLVKLILNETSSTVVVLALPELWDRIVRGARQESLQLRNRTAAKISLDSIGTDDARAVLRHHAGEFWPGLGKDESKAVAAIVREAVSFGLWNTVVSIAQEIAAVAGGPVTLDEVDRAISTVRALRH